MEEELWHGRIKLQSFTWIFCYGFWAHMRTPLARLPEVSEPVNPGFKIRLLEVKGEAH